MHACVDIYVYSYIATATPTLLYIIHMKITPKAVLAS